MHNWLTMVRIVSGPARHAPAAAHAAAPAACRSEFAHAQLVRTPPPQSRSTVASRRITGCVALHARLAFVAAWTSPEHNRKANRCRRASDCTWSVRPQAANTTIPPRASSRLCTLVRWEARGWAANERANCSRNHEHSKTMNVLRRWRSPAQPPTRPRQTRESKRARRLAWNQPEPALGRA